MAKCRHAFDRALWLEKPVPGSAQIETTCRACGAFIGRRWPEAKKAARPRDAEEANAAEAAGDEDLFTEAE